MAWHWMPFSFKVFLDLDLMVAAKRIINKMDPERLEHEHIPSEPQEYTELLQRRLDSETLRYKKLYNVDPFDKHNYDLVIDTSVTGPAEVAEQIINSYKEWLRA
jgi:cytidylate kinase